MECTGERYLPDHDADWTLEHVHRYLLAGELAKGKDVIDIACGEGYGSHMLAGAARRVTGVDVNASCVKLAGAKYARPNLAYVCGSATAIPVEDASADMVVSFETIEHLEEHDAMLREIRRVLRPGGLLLMSSPDKREYSDLPNYANEYHVKELYRDEFEALLGNYFAHYALSGQRVLFGSVVGAEKAADFVSWRKNEPGSRTNGLVNAEYLIAVASDAALPSLPSGMLTTPLAQSNKVLELEREKEHALARIAQLEGEAAEQGRLRLAREEELRALLNSHSWKLTRPLREAARVLRACLRRG